MNTRPTADRVKESLFNILSPYIPGCDVLDLFSGTGALAIEALSRGANSAVIVEADKKICAIIKENLVQTRLVEKAQVYCRKVSVALKELGKKEKSFDIVFIDPPYLKNFIQETLQLLVENDIIRKEGIVAMEHHRNESVPDRIGCLEKVRIEEYGETCISFLSVS
jgi:16S rRNA (guanine966-N2)-methyltransferase